MYKKSHIHFVGIGGIGMSGIAKILLAQGYRVSGCDVDLEQKSVEELKSLGCTVHKGNNSQGCHDKSIDVLVYSSAIKPHDPEICAAQERGIPIIPRALMLAELMRTKFSIAITGAHGKTTTTSLISHILIEGHRDPTVIIGGHLHSISTNARWGAGDFLVAEADESDRSLLRLYPTIAVVTNIDREHLDTYKDLDDIKQTFAQFLTNLPFYGKAIVCNDDPHIKSLLPLAHSATVRYGLDATADIYADNVVLGEDCSQFTVHVKNHDEDIVLGDMCLSMPGKHNVLNSLAAIAVARELDVPLVVIQAALTSFKGVDRRFTFKGTYKGAELFDDYGHHPTEIYHTLLVARKRARNKLIVVFQPHRYTRTQKLWTDFVSTFAVGTIDHLMITDIYPASEEAIAGITSELMVNDIRAQIPQGSVEYVPLQDNFSALRERLDALVQEGDLVLFLGAGKVNKLAVSLTKVPEV
jgi:UDP-N-acetylmuramate--alanine ligase